MFASGIRWQQEITKMWMDPELLKVSKHTQHLPLQNQEFVEVDVHVIRVTVTEKEEKGTVIKLLRFIFSFLFSNIHVSRHHLLCKQRPADQYLEAS